MNISITGLTACGKTFQSKILAKKLGYTYMGASDVLLHLIQKSHIADRCANGYVWLDARIVNAVEETRKLQNTDLQVDSMFLKFASEGDNYLLDTRTTPYLYTGANLTKIYLNPSIEDRTLISYHSKIEKCYSLVELNKLISAKDEADTQLFKSLYNIDITSTQGYDLVLDNGKLLPEETADILYRFVCTKCSSDVCTSEASITFLSVPALRVWATQTD